MYGPIATHASKSHVGNLDLCPHEATLRHSPLLWLFQRRQRRELRISFPLASSETFTASLLLSPTHHGRSHGEPGLPLPSGSNKAPLSPSAGMVLRRPSERSVLSPSSSVMRPSPLWCQWKQLGAPELLPLPSSNEGHLFSHVNGSQMGNSDFYYHCSNEVASHLPQLEQCQSKPAKTED